MCRHLSDFFMGPARAGLRAEDEPEKAKRLARMLALFQVHGPQMVWHQLARGVLFRVHST